MNSPRRGRGYLSWMGGGGDINFTRANSEGDTIIDDDVCCVLRIIVVASLVYDNIMWANLRLRLLTRGTEQSMMHACRQQQKRARPTFVVEVTYLLYHIGEICWCVS